MATLVSRTFALTLTYCVLIFLFTIFRLFVRGRSRWGWDDFWAVAGTFCFLIVTIQAGLTAFDFFKIVLNHKLMIALFYLEALAFAFGIWTARLSILYSLRRMSIAPRTTSILRWMTLLFYLGTLLCLSQIVVNCEVHTAWKQSPVPFCPWNASLPPTKIATAVISDIILVVLPFVVLRDLKSSPVFRTRLLVIFSASAIMTVSSVVTSVSLYTPDVTFSAIAGLTETFLGLVVCSLSVVITASIHLLGVNDGLQRPVARSASSTSKDLESGGLTGADDYESVSHRHPINSTFNTMDLRFETSVPTTATPTGSRLTQSVISEGDDKEEMGIDGVVKLQSSDEPTRTKKIPREDQTRSLPSLSSLIARWRNMDIDAGDDLRRARHLTDPHQ